MMRIACLQHVVRLTVAGSLLLIAGSSIAQEKVNFTFDWPAGLNATVEFNAKRTQSSGEREATRELVGSYAMRTTAVDGGLRVEFSDFKADAKIPTDTIQGKIQQFMADLGANLPNFVVNETGALVRLEGVTELRRQAIATFDELSKELPAEVKPRVDQALNTLISDGRLKRSIQSYWQRDVAAWNGRSEAPGSSHSQQQNRPMPMLQNVTVPTQTTISFVELRPCKDGMAADSCALLEVKSAMQLTEFEEDLATRLRGAIPNAPADLKFSSTSPPGGI
jgi:hypothetical protein